MSAKTDRFNLKFREGEREKLEKLANSAGVTLSRYLVLKGLNSQEFWSSKEVAAQSMLKLKGR